MGGLVIHGAGEGLGRFAPDEIDVDRSKERLAPLGGKVGPNRVAGEVDGEVVAVTARFFRA